MQRYLSTAYLGLPDPTGREIALRVIDETFWRSMIRTRQVTLDAFTTPRDGLPQPRRDPLKSSRTRRHADLLAAAGAVAQMLTDKASLDTLPYTAEDLDDFAREEVRAAPREPDIRPDQREADQSAALETMAEARRARDFARIWRILAEAKRQERPCSERLTLTQDDQGVRRIRLFGRCDLPKDAPLLLLDADADPKILRAFVPGARIETLSLRPNAHVVQVGDRRMSNGTLLKSDAIRRDWVAVIRAEVLRDRAGRKCGVLVGATRKVVRAFFRDAGHDFTGLSEAEVSARMLDTELHGARWTWFGGRALGENRYRDFSTAIVIGREELPVAALEDQARALFGDTPGETLACIAPDGDGRRLLPDETVAYPVEHGRARGAWVRIHPDPRIAALQRQTRECATRQLVERLRLPHATYPKRVLLGCNIPIPGLPVSRLVNFEDLVPSRLAKACLEAFLENRPLRLSAPGLHADASHTFPTLEAAKCFVKRSLQSEIEDLRLGCTMLRVRLRTAVRGARSVDVLVPAQDAQTARAMAETAYGALARFDLISAVSYGKIGNRSKGRQAGVQDPLGFVSPRLRPTA